MRHNAHLTIISEDSPPFNIFLDSYGSPPEIKLTTYRALRGMRRDIMRDTERFAVNIIQLSKRGTVHLTEYAATYLWTYEFHLLPPIPKVTIIREGQGISKTTPLFVWIGPEHALSEKRAPKRISEKGGKRGRPSALSKDSRLQQHYVRPPLYIRDDGTPVFEE